jgi:hypothetical protein
MKTWIPIKLKASAAFLATLAFCFLGRLAQAQSNDVDAKISELEGEAMVMGDPVAKRYVEFAQQVSRGAKVEAIKLCESYRRATMGPSQSQAPYQYSRLDSAKAWARIYKEGFLVPLSVIDGTKSDFNAQNNVRIWQIDSWIRSTYVFNLIHSKQFHEGEVECLGTDDPATLQIFEGSILAADYEAGIAAQVGIWLSGARILGFVAKIAGRVLAVPARSLVNMIPEGVIEKYVTTPANFMKYYSDKVFTKSNGILTAMIVLPIGVDNYFDYMNKMGQARDLAQGLLDKDSKETKEMHRHQRILLISMATQVFYKELSTQGHSEDFPNTQTWVKKNIHRADLSGAHDDLKTIDTNDEEDISYEKILKAILPILDQIELN